jgi:hypothetical protein
LSRRGFRLRVLGHLESCAAIVNAVHPLKHAPCAVGDDDRVSKVP